MSDEKTEKALDVLEAVGKKEVQSRGILDCIQEKIVSRKLLVFGTATSLLIWSGLDANTWGMIAMCYIGGQSAIDFAKVWRG